MMFVICDVNKQNVFSAFNGNLNAKVKYPVFCVVESTSHLPCI